MKQHFFEGIRQGEASHPPLFSGHTLFFSVVIQK